MSTTRGVLILAARWSVSTLSCSQVWSRGDDMGGSRFGEWKSSSSSSVGGSFLMDLYVGAGRPSSRTASVIMSRSSSGRARRDMLFDEACRVCSMWLVEYVRRGVLSMLMNMFD